MNKKDLLIKIQAELSMIDSEIDELYGDIDAEFEPELSKRSRKLLDFVTNELEKELKNEK